MKQTIVLYPSPGRGHLLSMLEFGRHLLTHHPDSFSITVIISAPDAAAVSASVPSITFLHLPDITTASGSPFEFVRLQNPNLRDALLSIPNVKAFVADFFLSAVSEVAAGLDIPIYFYFTSGAICLAMFLYLPTTDKIFTRGFNELGDQIVHVPGLPPLPATEIPTGMSNRSSGIYGFCLETSARLAASAGLIVNTCRVFEEMAVTAIESGQCVPDGPTPPVYCIGPLIATSGDGESGNRDVILSWLDSQPSQSVLYLSFGSKGTFSKEQLKEMAVALETSGVRFLWVVRNPPPNDQTQRTIAAPALDLDLDLDLDSILPGGFVERTREKGLVVKSWAPQVAVLSHESVGGFVTHCGWNSILEAVCAGVPMLAWPLRAEQKLNRAFLVKEAGAALTVAESESGFVSATELEKRVAELMNSEEGQVVRDRVKVLQERAMAALSEGGSSRVALAQLAESFAQA